MTKTVELEYARRPRWYWRRRWRRGVGVLLVVGLAVGIWRWGPAVWGRAELMYWQRECLNYDGGGMVVLEEEPGAMEKLLASGKGYSEAAIHSELGLLGVGYVPSCFKKFADLNSTGLSIEPVLFLHKRVSKNGTEQLIVVECDAIKHRAIAMTSSFDMYAIPCLTWMGTSPGMQIPQRRVNEKWEINTHHIRFFAGRADAADESHFTIGFEKDGVAGVIDGWLRDSGEVELKERS